MQKKFSLPAAVFALALLPLYAHGQFSYVASPLSNGQASYFDSNFQFHNSLSLGLSNSAGSGGSIAFWSVTPYGFTYFVKAADNGGASIDVNANASWQDPMNPPQSKSKSTGISADVTPPTGYYAKINVTVTHGQKAAGAHVYTKTGQPFPGARPERPAPPSSCSDCGEGENERALESVPVTGSYLTGLPVEEDFGVQNSLYFGPESNGQVAEAPTGYHPTSYYFISRTNLPITSFVTPNGILGDTSGVVIDDGTTLIPYVPGTTHIFSTPVTEFALRGLDDSAMPIETAPAPFVYGLQFAAPGVAMIAQATDQVPAIPGDFNRDTLVDAADYITWRKSPTAHGSNAHTTWKGNYGNSFSAGGGSSIQSASVPEPSTVLLLGMGAIGLFGYRNARSRD